MNEALFGLIGVIVGGVLQGASQWTMERQRSTWAARKAGRLFAPKLGRCDFILNAAHERGTSWTMLGLELRQALLAWPEHADAFAGTLRADDWNKLVQAIMHFERIEQLAGVHPDPHEEIDKDTREYLGWVGTLAFDAMLTSGLVGVAGPNPSHRLTRIRRRLRHPFKKRDLDAEANRIMAVYRGRTPDDQAPDADSGEEQT